MPYFSRGKVNCFTSRTRRVVLILGADQSLKGLAMISRQAMMTINLLVLATALLVAGNFVLVRPVLPRWVTSFTFEAVKPFLACPYLIPPDCVEPLPGL